VFKLNIKKQIIGWEVYSQEGNSPELLLKSQITFKFRINMNKFLLRSTVGLEAVNQIRNALKLKILIL